MVNIVRTNGGMKLLARTFPKKSHYFYKPCLSSQLGIYVVNISKVSPLFLVNTCDVLKKYVVLPHKGNLCVLIPLLHSGS